MYNTVGILQPIILNPKYLMQPHTRYWTRYTNPPRSFHINLDILPFGPECTVEERTQALVPCNIYDSIRFYIWELVFSNYSLKDQKVLRK